jgi:hypothetical protein
VGAALPRHHSAWPCNIHLSQYYNLLNKTMRKCEAAPKGAPCPALFGEAL